ncbi:MAG: hypothetical protein KBD66_01155 [Candidatus Doudnabacteria bacterium]|nr:hypothetical protein [Candidatus Doudnabacteria bacterium]
MMAKSVMNFFKYVRRVWVVPTLVGMLLAAVWGGTTHPVQAFGDPNNSIIEVAITCSQEAHWDSSGRIYEWEISASAQAEYGDATIDVVIQLSSPTWSSGSGSASVRVIVPGSFLPAWTGSAYTHERPGFAGSGDSCSNGGGGDSEEPTPTPTAPDRAPQGNFDIANCSSLIGWAFDADAPGQSINVDVYKDGPAGSGSFVGRYLANQPRPDVNSAFGLTGDHGFVIETPDVFKDGQQHQVYVYAINNAVGGLNPQLAGSPKPISCPIAPPCPSGMRVILDSFSVEVGSTVRVYAPQGWSGGSFTSSNSNASVGAVAVGANNAVVTGIAPGVSQISGTGWTTNTGATGCGLEPADLSVTPANYTGTLTVPNFEVCTPQTAGSVLVMASASTFAEVRIYKANVPDGTVFMTVPANGSTTNETGAWVKNGTEFRLVAPLGGGSEIARVAVTVTQKDCPGAPTVDLKANGSDGPVTVPEGGTVQLTWQSQNATACAAEDEWTSSTAVSGQQGVSVVRRTVFGIVCTGPGGQARDVVEVLVTPTPPVLPPLVDAWVYNTATAPAGLTVPCGQIGVVWTESERKVSGYRIYYYNSATASWNQLAQISNNQLQPFGNKYQALITPQIQNEVSYRVYAYLDAAEYVATKDAIGSPLSAVPCGTGVDLSPSNKDIVKIRTVDLCKLGRCNPYNDQDSPIKPALPVNEGDTVTFTINLVNGGTKELGDPISVDDVLTNMVEPSGGFGISIACSNQCDLVVNGYSAVTSTIRMTVTPRPGQSLAPLAKEAWTITLTAKTQAPNGKSGQPFRFRNRAFLNGITGPLLTTPYILVLPVGTPTIEEIQ